MPCATSASELFCVVRRGVERMRPLPRVLERRQRDVEVERAVDRAEREADRATSRRRAGRFTAVAASSLAVPAARIGRAPAVPPTRPPSEPLFGNARPVVLPIAEFARPLKPHWMPSARAKSRVVWTMRASTSTCGCALSSVAISDCAVCRRSGRSVMMSVLVRVSTWIWPRAESADFVQQRRERCPPWRS